MSRIAQYLGAIVAIALFVFVVTRAPVSPQVPTSTTEIVQVPLSTISTQDSTPSTTEPLRRPTNVAAVQVANELWSKAKLETAAARLRSALVNILCIVPAKSGLHSISASGVLVSPNGMILTNAHVAQYFLLADRGVSCEIRTGSPAVSAYKAKLAFISPYWVRDNASVITEAMPVGTGENDFAILAVTEFTQATSSPLASHIFPHVPLASAPSAINTPAAIASYGAQFLNSDQIRSALYPTVVLGSIKDIFTFGTNTPDVLTFGGSVAAQEGSSGGGIVDASGSLIGTITTSITTGTLENRSVSAITASYMRAEYLKESGRTIDTLFAQSNAATVADFAQLLPTLEAVITSKLP